MPKTIFFVLLIEAFLIVLTTTLLSRPAFLNRAGGSRKLSVWPGFFLLCVTFLWSLVLGIVMGAGDLTFRF